MKLQRFLLLPDPPAGASVASAASVAALSDAASRSSAASEASGPSEAPEGLEAARPLEDLEAVEVFLEDLLCGARSSLNVNLHVPHRNLNSEHGKLKSEADSREILMYM